eukprot:CAMPEP_0119533636 /NCGR_PEP_ID=MMETSP1344-20130328/46996_1 /TAXON_ID=236787 /ORGANISM="Florenciella parvula, Strain CCMP2471" /LENGTH=66 /DNA_ID=CAMNT_0007574591 /DNA_START=17 /DNA_END=217 /DNA_ORIENTATION=-
MRTSSTQAHEPPPLPAQLCALQAATWPPGPLSSSGRATASSVAGGKRTTTSAQLLQGRFARCREDL